jgi:hypothetical protein
MNKENKLILSIINSMPLNKLDTILQLLAGDFGKGGVDFDSLVIKVFKTELIEDGMELIEILDKLKKDKYIISFSKGINRNMLHSLKMEHVVVDYYKITFEGRVFISQAGYKGEVIAKEAENVRLNKIENNQRVNRVLMAFLTGILAVGTVVAAIYYGLQIWDRYNP